MRTFDTSLSARWFWGAVFIPPLCYFSLLQVWSGPSGSVASQMAGLLVLLALAQGMPVAALGWTLCSVAAYSIGPGRLVVHRVLGDRVYSLREVTAAPALDGDAVVVLLPHRRLRLRVAQPELCLKAVLEATRLRTS